jgi:hypothetical protein
MANLPAEFKKPNPSSSERRLMPPESMAFWSRETWASWLVDGIRVFSRDTRENRAVAFVPLTLDPDVGDATELFRRLKIVANATAMLRFEEGLASAISAWCSEDGAATACFLIELTGLVEGHGPRYALKAMFQKPVNFDQVPDADTIADAIAFVLSRRGDSNLITELKPFLDVLLPKSFAATILVSAREALDDASNFVPGLVKSTPRLFALPVDHPDWRFVVNKLLERAGIEKAMEAAFLDRSGTTAKLREALKTHRLDIMITDRHGITRILDRLDNRIYSVRTQLLSQAIYVIQGGQAARTGEGGSSIVDVLDREMREGLGVLLTSYSTQFDPAGDPADFLASDEPIDRGRYSQ